jgi:hypothetical protein
MGSLFLSFDNTGFRAIPVMKGLHQINSVLPFCFLCSETLDAENIGCWNRRQDKPKFTYFCVFFKKLPKKTV